MFDQKRYVETFSTLHASQDTLTEIRRITEQRPQKIKPFLRPAFLLSVMLVLIISSIALAAGSQLLYGGWVHHASLRDVEKMGFHYPEQIGEYRLVKTSPVRIHAAPSESNWLTAWLNPDYTWMSLDYENERSQSLSVSFGKMDDPLWAYCFSYNEKTGVWLGAEDKENYTPASEKNCSYIENVNEYEYEERTIYLADRVTEYVFENDVSEDNLDNDVFIENLDLENADSLRSASWQRTEVEAHWTDPENGLCFSISSGMGQIRDEKDTSNAAGQNMTQSEMLKYVKAVIDCQSD